LDHAEKNGSLGEIAVDSRGNLFAISKDSNKIEQIHMSKFDINKYIPLTNSDLAEYRKNSSAETGN